VRLFGPEIDEPWRVEGMWDAGNEATDDEVGVKITFGYLAESGVSAGTCFEGRRVIVQKTEDVVQNLWRDDHR
jgi:hypothetical protein